MFRSQGVSDMSTRTRTPGVTFAVQQVEPASPIVAWSFAEFLDRALAGGGSLERLKPPR
jgi:hypothetical protein